MREIPRPGGKVRGSRTGAPIMALFDLLGRRWGMGVLWTICEQGTATFGRLQLLCESISPAVLSLRLKELQAAGFVERTLAGYEGTKLGQRVYRELVPLGATAKVWSTELAKGTRRAARRVANNTAAAAERPRRSD